MAAGRCCEMLQCCGVSSVLEKHPALIQDHKDVVSNANEWAVWWHDLIVGSGLGWSFLDPKETVVQHQKSSCTPFLALKLASSVANILPVLFPQFSQKSIYIGYVNF